MTVAHGFGETVVPAAPKRVVSFGDTDLDALLALGVVPVGIMQVPDTLPPWTRLRLFGARPVQALWIPGVPRLGPAELGRVDLIEVASGPINRGLYPAYRRVAPTVAAPEGVDPGGSTAWQDVTRLAGQAVGRPAAAERLIGDLEARTAGIRARYPQLAGRTGVCVAIDGYGFHTYGVDVPRRPCSRFLAGLGLRAVPALQVPPGSTADTTPPEAFAGANRPDVVVLSEAGEQSRVTARRYLPPDVRSVMLTDDEAERLEHLSVLSLPSALDTIPPKLARALG